MDKGTGQFDASVLERQASVMLTVPIPSEVYQPLNADPEDLPMVTLEIQATNWFLLFEILSNMHKTHAALYSLGALTSEFPGIDMTRIPHDETYQELLGAFTTAIHHDFRTYVIELAKKDIDQITEITQAEVTMKVTAPSITIGSLGIIDMTRPEKIEELAAKVMPLSSEL